MAQIFLPYVELFRKQIPASLEEIKEAGFDGVECHLIGGLRSKKRVAQLMEEVAGLGMGIRFHQGWSWNTGQRNLYNVILRPLGALVPVGMSLADQVEHINPTPVVLYGNRINEASSDNYLYQTASEQVHGKEYAMTFGDFRNAVKMRKPSLVFDTQHVLEWYLNKPHVSDLPTLPSLAGDMVDWLWQELHPFVQEIHLCDFDPRLGPSLGRNVYLGNGVFPLSEFCHNVRASGWDGVVTPEVSSQHLLKKNALPMLYDKVATLFH